MRPVSARFVDALNGSHTMAVRLTAVPAGQTGVAPSGGTALDIISGNVQLDGNADIRSDIQCEVAAYNFQTGQLLWPAETDSALTPYGHTELFAERGVAFGGGSVEYVSLGYFRIDNVEQPDAPDGPIRMTGTDRMSMIVKAKLTEPVQYGPTATYGDVVEELVVDAYADAEIEWDDADIEGDAIGRTVVIESDRYAFLKDLATSVGKVIYFDHRGIFVVRNLPDPTTPLWVVSRGRNGVLVSAARSISNEGVYNGVVAVGEAFDTVTPSRGVAVDDNPDSPTFWGGPFGKVPREFASPLLTTDAQARLAAATVLRKSLGLPYNVDFSAVPHPGLEPGDPVAIGLEGTPQVVIGELVTGDSFSRTVVDGIGTNDSGHAWNIAAGASSLYQVTGGVLNRQISNNFTATNLLPASIGRRDVDVFMDVQVPIVASGAALVVGPIVRYSSSSDFYALRLEFNAGGTTTLKITSFFPSIDDVATLVGFDTYSAGEWWTIRARSRGDVLEMKAWPRADSQPGPWMLSISDARPAGATANQFGKWYWRVGGNTNNTSPQYVVDNFRAYTVPRTSLRGGELHVMDTLTVPLTADAAMAGTTREQTLVVIGEET